jgi:hypothetical protein
LNIPRAVHTGKTRQIRKFTNHKLNKSVDEVKMTNELSNQYFKNLSKLTPEMVELHEVKIFETLQYRQYIAEKM